MSYQPIENYGIIGDLHTCALVAINGSIDWFCFPHFDSPSVFGAILDDKKGGRFSICPKNEDITFKQLYWPDTNVLVTRFLSHTGIGEITDFMTIHPEPGNHKKHQLIRIISVVRGEVRFDINCTPAFNYARDKHTTSIEKNKVIFRSGNLALYLINKLSFEHNNTGVAAELTMKEGDSTALLLEEFEPNSDPNFNIKKAENLFNQTVKFWRNWLSKCTYTGRWREMVNRSALTLKLLTYEPTGAIVAAPTTSLPENIGGERNWDYRYTWIRDAAFTLYGLIRIGFTEEAASFMRFLEERCHEPKEDGSLQIMYGINGRHKLTEESLDHLEGYRGSKPVRIGNDAYHQLQLDIYGELMDSVYLYNKYRSPISYDLWTLLRRLVNYVCENWTQKDEGIWEVRGGKQHFVYSKLMCWVAMDRAVRLANKRSFPADHGKWVKCRDEIYETIMKRGWSSKREAFSQSFGNHALDSANLIMPLVFFVSPSDPRMLKTLDTINQSPSKGGLVANSLVYRYNLLDSPDGLGGNEGTFNMCTFWLVEAMTRAGRFDKKRLDQARLIFEKMLGFANHLGLYAEETGPSGEALGNFPQAFTHLSLISAAYNLDRALGRL